MDPELSELTDVYLRQCLTRDDDDFWAWEEVERLVRAGFDEAWTILTILVHRAAADFQLGYIAAGPLEDFVDGYGDAALDAIEAACENDQKMQLALSGIMLERESPVLMRWRGLMKRYGFMEGSRQPLAMHPDCWF